MDHLDPFAGPFWTVVGVAIFCGAIVGLERQLRCKPAGVRTSILVCLGTAVYMHLGGEISGQGSDHTRVLGQIVTGVGFLGAGVMFSRQGVVTGVTTAAVIWVLAAVGAAIGLERYAAAIALALVIVLLLVCLDLLESRVQRLARGVYQRDRE